jgi:hypothetical protein
MQMFMAFLNILKKLKVALLALGILLWVFLPFMMADTIYKIKFAHGRILPKGSILSLFDSYHPQYMVYHILSVVLGLLILGDNIRYKSTHGLKKVLGITSLCIVLIDFIAVLLFSYSASIF